MAITNTAAFGNQLDRDQDEVFWDQYGTTMVEYDKIAKIQEAPPGNYYKLSELSPLGALREKGEGASTEFDTPVEGDVQTHYYTEYSLGYQITRAMYDDDVFQHLRDMPEKLGKSAALKPESVFFDLFNSGFDTHTAIDGEYIFDTDHPVLKTGGTTANEPTTAGSLSETTYQAAMEYFHTLNDEAGQPLRLPGGFTLMVPEDLRYTAMKLQGNEGKIGTANNDMNIANPSSGVVEPYKIHVSRFLTSSTAWFVLSDWHDFRLLWKSRPEFESADDFYTGNALFKVWMRFLVFCGQWKGAYGNPGA